jgi:Bifunctional DNA primase/polymerase, N-terminal
LPADALVVDIDVGPGRNGFADFKRIAGCDPHEGATPQASTPRAGRHVIYRAAKAYRNLAGIGGTGLDVRALGGYIALPSSGNGRTWLKPLIGADGAIAQLQPAPAWLDVALRKAPLVLAPRAAIAPPSSDPYAQRKAQADLARACAKIVAAPCGAQDAERHRQSYFVGGLIARGDLDYATAYAALLAAALAMPVHRAGDPWRNIETRVARSIEAGLGQPLALSVNEQWVRDFRARMRAKRPGARHG